MKCWPLPTWAHFPQFWSLLSTPYQIKSQVGLQLTPSTISISNQGIHCHLSYCLLSFDLTCFSHLCFHMKKKLLLTYKTKLTNHPFGEALLGLSMAYLLLGSQNTGNNCNDMFIGLVDRQSPGFYIPSSRYLFNIY